MSTGKEIKFISVTEKYSCVTFYLLTIPLMINFLLIE